MIVVKLFELLPTTDNNFEGFNLKRKYYLYKFPMLVIMLYLSSDKFCFSRTRVRRSISDDRH